MTSDRLENEALALPLHERVTLAQTLWQSINETPEVDPAEAERLAIAAAWRRDADLASGTVSGRTHDQVMEAARRSLG